MVTYVNESRCITVEAHGSTLLIDTTGAQIVSWITKDYGEQMYISALCKSPPEASIRAGSPVCWPQFAVDGKLSKHGIVRMQPWKVEENKDGKAVLSITLKDFECNGFMFSCTCWLTVIIEDGNTIKVDLTAKNERDEPIQNQTCAFHPYWAIEDIHQIRFEGVVGAKGWDKTGRRTPQAFVETEASVAVPCPHPIDTKYQHDKTPIPFSVLNRGSNDSRGNIKATLITGFEDVVVWNIGQAEVGDLTDMPDSDWTKYVCMEQAQLVPDELAPGATKSWTTRWSVSK